MNFKALTLQFSGFIALFLCILILIYPRAVLSGFSSGVSLCINSVLPALFPFFVLCNLVLASGACAVLGFILRPITKICAINGTTSAGLLVLSWLGGYAVCADSLQSELSGRRIDNTDAIKLLLLGCCSSPGFVIGCIGGQWLGSVTLGILLYFIQISANLLASALLLLFLHIPTRPISQPVKAVSNASHSNLATAIDGAIRSSLCVCGCIIFFRILGAVFTQIFVPNEFMFAFVSGLLEISSGCDAFSAIGGAAALYGICALLSLLSFSVLAQIAALLHFPHAIMALAASRVLHCVIFLSEIRLCILFLPELTLQAISTLGEKIIPMRRLSPDTAFIVFVFFCLLLYNVCQKIYNRTNKIKQ